MEVCVNKLCGATAVLGEKTDDKTQQGTCVVTFYWRGAICAERLLDQLPEWLDIPELLSWLQQFVPDLL